MRFLAILLICLQKAWNNKTAHKAAISLDWIEYL